MQLATISLFPAIVLEGYVGILALAEQFGN
jgi:hypothetical protein